MGEDICQNYHGGNMESVAAHDSIVHTKAGMHQVILRLFADRNWTGDEIEVNLRLRHQTVSARLAELKAAGLLIDTGERRPTRSGRNAAVLALAPSQLALW